MAVYTTVYPGVEKFLPEWRRSLRAQSDRDFDLWIGVDGLDPAWVRTFMEEDRTTIAAGQQHGTPAEIRQRAIAEMVERYAAVVFVDSDDVLDPTRVSAARKALEKWDVVACALRIVDEAGRDAGAQLEPPASVDWDSFLPRQNVFGLSNSAYCSEVLRQCLPLPADSVLVDWLLVTRAWALGATLHFDRTVRMAYRQYGANTARVLPPFTTSDVQAAAERVANHYDCLLRDGAWPLPERYQAALRDARERLGIFRAAVQEPERLRTYVEALNGIPPQYVWWWAVAHPDLETIWKS